MTVNGEEITVTNPDPRMTLARWLREDRQLKVKPCHAELDVLAYDHLGDKDLM